MIEESGLKRVLLEKARIQRVFTFKSIVEDLGLDQNEIRVARRVFADLVKEGYFERIPDYERKIVIYKIKEN